MKYLSKIKSSFLILACALFIASCDKEDNTGSNIVENMKATIKIGSTEIIFDTKDNDIQTSLVEDKLLIIAEDDNGNILEVEINNYNGRASYGVGGPLNKLYLAKLTTADPMKTYLSKDTRTLGKFSVLDVFNTWLGGTFELNLGPEDDSVFMEGEFRVLL